MMRLRVLPLLVLVALASEASAQPPPPRGPADVITRAQEAQAAEDRAEATEVPAAPPTSDEPAEDAAMAAHAARALAEPQVASAEPSREVPAGEIRVTVLDASGEPARGAPVRLGIMGTAGDRESKNAQTDAAGEARFRGLPTGSARAYRVNVLHQGATYSTAPFRLEPDQGQIVRVVRLPVTRDDQAILQWIGGTFIEIKPERRLHVVQQTELVNLGRETYVMPRGGLHVQLPPGFTAFQSQQVMTDQRVVPDDRGFRLEGSLPPGRVQLTWAFDLPIGGDEVTFSQRVPFRTYQYIVVTEHTPGLELDVTGFPPAQRGEDRGRAHLATRIERTPDQEPWDRLRVTIRGIPGPGPERAVAVVLALAFLGLGVHLAKKRGGPDREAAALREERQEELLEEARELEAAFAREEIGPKYHERRRREIVDELAILLGMERAEAAAPAEATPRGR